MDEAGVTKTLGVLNEKFPPCLILQQAVSVAPLGAVIAL